MKNGVFRVILQANSPIHSAFVTWHDTAFQLTISQETVKAIQYIIYTYKYIL